MNISLSSYLYDVIHSKGLMSFKGNITVSTDNKILHIYGPIFHENKVVGGFVWNPPHYRIYNEQYKQEILNFIDEVKQELINLGYVVA